MPSSENKSANIMICEKGLNSLKKMLSIPILLGSLLGNCSGSHFFRSSRVPRGIWGAWSASSVQGLLGLQPPAAVHLPKFLNDKTKRSTIRTCVTLSSPSVVLSVSFDNRLIFLLLYLQIMELCSSKVSSRVFATFLVTVTSVVLSRSGCRGD